MLVDDITLAHTMFLGIDLYCRNHAQTRGWALGVLPRLRPRTWSRPPLLVALLEQDARTRRLPEVPANPNHSAILPLGTKYQFLVQQCKYKIIILILTELPLFSVTLKAGVDKSGIKQTEV